MNAFIHIIPSDFAQLDVCGDALHLGAFLKDSNACSLRLRAIFARRVLRGVTVMSRHLPTVGFVLRAAIYSDRWRLDCGFSVSHIRVGDD